MPGKVADRVMMEARRQQRELDAEAAAAGRDDMDGDGDGDGDGDEVVAGPAGRGGDVRALLGAALRRGSGGKRGGRGGGGSSDDDDNDDDDDDGLVPSHGEDLGPVDDLDPATHRGRFDESRGDEPGAAHETPAALQAELDGEERAVSGADRRALEAFMLPAKPGGMANRNLGDVLLAKIQAAQARAAAAAASADADAAADNAAAATANDDDDEPDAHEIALLASKTGLSPRVVRVYRGVGRVLARHTTGRVPKAFKAVPGLAQWEEVLWLTEPDSWTPQAVHTATRLFVSGLNARLAQRFVALVLLPRLRRELADTKKLHFETFQALKRSLYKPAAFYKGLLLPLAASRTCTLREAFVVAAVVKRVRVPVLHSAAALLRLAELEYGGTTSFLITSLLHKKYALPYRVVDALAEHFARFTTEERRLPVCWHQSLLALCQRYGAELRAEDRERLRRLCDVQRHAGVTPGVLGELAEAERKGGRLGAAARRREEREAAERAAASKGAAGGGEDPRRLPTVIMADDD